MSTPPPISAATSPVRCAQCGQKALGECGRVECDMRKQVTARAPGRGGYQHGPTPTGISEYHE